jgi:hypothetical protein
VSHHEKGMKDDKKAMPASKPAAKPAAKPATTKK